MRVSAGGVILGPEGKLVLVEQHGNSWSFPKGGVEEGESFFDAARREIEEETGLKDLTLVQELGSYKRKSIAPGGVGETDEWGVSKRVFFLFTTDEHEFHLKDKEVTQAKWVTLDEALQLLSHPKDKEFLIQSRATIEKCLN